MKPEKLVMAELIGLNIKVLSSKNFANLSLHGVIVDETKSTLVIETATGMKRLMKYGCVFELEFENKKFSVDGRLLAKRPEERIKIKDIKKLTRK